MSVKFFLKRLTFHGRTSTSSSAVRLGADRTHLAREGEDLLLLSLAKKRQESDSGACDSEDVGREVGEEVGGRAEKELDLVRKDSTRKRK